MRSVGIVACWMLAACPATPPPAKPGLIASGPKLPAPKAIDPGVRGAAYLATVAEQLQPAWAQFLEDCRLRLPADHPLNQPGLATTAELVVTRDGRVFARIANGSGNGDFDTAVYDVASDAGPLPPPPAELISDDDKVHLSWLFARDVRQAGAATAKVIDVKLPLLEVIGTLLEAKAIDRAIARLQRSESDRDFLPATEQLMIAVIAEGLASGNGAGRRAAVEAVARANLGGLAAEVRAIAGPNPDLDLRLAAIATSARLHDATIAPTLATDLRADLATPARQTLALAKIDALVALGQPALAAPAIRAALSAGPTELGLLALARVPDPELAPRFVGWFASREPRTRGAVCDALPSAAPALSARLLATGLRDADASVRAKCCDAATRGDKRGLAIARRLRELARDRDVTVRERAIAALGVIEPAHKLRAITDPSPAIRLASAVGAPDGDLRTLVRDPDPDVRAAALTALAERAPELMVAAANDPAAVVRRVAVAGLVDDKLLDQLANDPAPEVATAALIRIATRRGRSAEARPLLARLAATPAGAPARVRIALAWLLAP